MKLHLGVSLLHFRCIPTAMLPAAWVDTRHGRLALRKESHVVSDFLLLSLGRHIDRAETAQRSRDCKEDWSLWLCPLRLRHWGNSRATQRVH